ncbi:MAG TPA: hypothetical protein PKD54_08785 [Pirellulaceae bacterium]|nr:hypothetical protein [Pirellulaceae bacterium]
MVLPRHNRFAAQHLDALVYCPLNESWEQLTSRLADMNFRALIVGPEGRGKSTLLRGLSAWWMDRGYPAGTLRLAWGQRRLTLPQLDSVEKLPDEAILFVDSLEQLSWFGWRQLKAKSNRLRGILATSHRGGRLPILIECRTTLQLLIDLVKRLTGSADELDSDFLRALFVRHRGDIRRCLRALYDWESQRPVPLASNGTSPISAS